jgi:hypothetical protein
LIQRAVFEHTTIRHDSVTTNVNVRKTVVVVCKCHENNTVVALVIEELGAAMWRSLNQNVLPIYGPTTFWEIPSFLKTVGYFLPFPRSS